MNFTSKITVTHLNPLDFVPLLERPHIGTFSSFSAGDMLPRDLAGEPMMDAGWGRISEDREQDFVTSLLEGIESVTDPDTALLQFPETTAKVSDGAQAAFPEGLFLVDGGGSGSTTSILIGGGTDCPGVVSVQIDHEAAIELSLRHLKELGHSRIAFLRQPQQFFAAESRWESTRFVARRLGIDVDSTRVVQLSYGSVSAGESAVRRLLSQTRDFSALFCPNDFAALGAISALRQAGLECPRDVSVVGCDQLDATAGRSAILTTVRGPLRRMGSLAAETLLAHVCYPQMKQPASILLAPELAVRSSTGPAASLDRLWIAMKAASDPSTTARMANH